MLDKLKAIIRELEDECHDHTVVILNGQIAPENYQAEAAIFRSKKVLWDRLQTLVKEIEES